MDSNDKDSFYEFLEEIREISPEKAKRYEILFTTRFMSMNDSFQFDCKHCGKCCRTLKSIHVCKEDIYRLKDHLQITVTELKEYIRSTEYPMTWELKRSDQGCIFLDENGCTVYPVRPEACRVFPVGYNPGKEKPWSLVHKDDFNCPGIEEGKTVWTIRQWLIENDIRFP